MPKERGMGSVHFSYLQIVALELDVNRSATTGFLPVIRGRDTERSSGGEQIYCIVSTPSHTNDGVPSPRGVVGEDGGWGMETPDELG